MDRVRSTQNFLTKGLKVIVETNKIQLKSCTKMHGIT
jgi:hypothetical protein